MWDPRLYPSAPYVTDRDRFAWSLRTHRTSRGLTMQQVADGTGIPMSTIAHWETAYCDAGLPGVIALADFFCVPLDQLVGREKPMESHCEVWQRAHQPHRWERHDGTVCWCDGS